MNIFLKKAISDLEAQKSLTLVRLRAAQDDVAEQGGVLSLLDEAIEKMKTIVEREE